MIKTFIYQVSISLGKKTLPSRLNVRFKMSVVWITFQLVSNPNTRPCVYVFMVLQFTSLLDFYSLWQSHSVTGILYFYRAINSTEVRAGKSAVLIYKTFMESPSLDPNFPHSSWTLKVCYNSGIPVNELHMLNKSLSNTCRLLEALVQNSKVIT